MNKRFPSGWDEERVRRVLAHCETRAEEETITLEGEMPMPVVETQYEHVILNGDNVPVIAGTNMQVIELVLGRMAYGWSPEELYFQHPYLTLGQIHSALAYYWDHKEELDRDIEQRLEFVDRLQRAREHSPLVARLRAKGLI